VSSKGNHGLTLVWEGDEADETHKLIYNQVLRKVCQISNAALLNMGVQQANVVAVTLYIMPMIPKLAMTMLFASHVFVLLE
jgi:acyl-coenzyme A synthetase/AMP-(fatty) acid ligase